jgi:ribosomal protein S18 acetylase RimI-like enzyme
MIAIDPFRPSDLATVIQYVEAIQEFERIHVPELKLGHEIGPDYASMLIRRVAERNGCMLMARAETRTVGFGCAWIQSDYDMLLREDARTHAYVSDIFVEDDWRRRGIALKILVALETEMRSRGCRRIRICSKATNQIALECYKRAGYRPYEITFTKDLDI